MKASYLISAMALIAAVAMAQPGLYTRQYDTGTITVAPGQTARLNVLYPTIPAPGATQALCSGTLLIVDDQNDALKTQSVTQLVGGRSVSIDLNADTDLPSGTSRAHLHAVVLTPGCSVVPTLEVLDNVSGKSGLVLKGKVTWPPAATTITPLSHTPQH